MSRDYEELCATLGMSEIIRLRDRLSKALATRFGTRLALVVSEAVGAIACFGRYGDEAGRGLQQRHYDLLGRIASERSGRIVESAGDLVLLSFPGADEAVDAAMAVQRAAELDRLSRPEAQGISLRLAVHCGPVLADGDRVTGEAVEVCARIASTGEAHEIRLSRDAFVGLSGAEHRLRCSGLAPVALWGLAERAEVVRLDWRDRKAFPSAVRFEDGTEVLLPDKEVISFGRLAQLEGGPANDIVLRAADPGLNSQIGRWHFELRRRPEGFVLRSVSAAPTQVDGELVGAGHERPVRVGTAIKVAHALWLELVSPSDEATTDADLATLMNLKG